MDLLDGSNGSFSDEIANSVGLRVKAVAKCFYQRAIIGSCNGDHFRSVRGIHGEGFFAEHGNPSPERGGGPFQMKGMRRGYVHRVDLRVVQ